MSPLLNTNIKHSKLKNVMRGLISSLSKVVKNSFCCDNMVQHVLMVK